MANNRPKIIIFEGQKKVRSKIFKRAQQIFTENRFKKKKSFIETCTQNDIVFDPQFMV